MKKILLLTFSVFSIFSLNAAENLDNEIKLWPGVAPGSDGVSLTEEIDVRTPTDECSRDWAITKISTPSITPFIPDSTNGSAVLICPGGGYAKVVYDKEGTDIAEWYNSYGVAAFVLKYRLPIEGHANRRFVPLQDAQRAMRYIKSRADSFGIDSSKIGIMGGSAGGHLAASLSTHYNWETYSPIDSIDSINARPAFSVFLYPVISFQSSLTHTGSRDNLLGSSPSTVQVDSFSNELYIDSLTPPAFLAHSKVDGSVKYANSQVYADSLTKYGVYADLNLYSSGGHGIGKCKAGGTDFYNWVYDCAEWLDSLELIKYEAPSLIQSQKSPTSFQVYPNPASEKATVSYFVDKPGNVLINTYDIRGRNIKTLVNEFHSAGTYSIEILNTEASNNRVMILQMIQGNINEKQKIVFN